LRQRTTYGTFLKILVNRLMESQGVGSKSFFAIIQPAILKLCAKFWNELLLLGVSEAALRADVCPTGWTASFCGFFRHVDSADSLMCVCLGNKERLPKGMSVRNAANMNSS
jgi:hypothetical protein